MIKKLHYPDSYLVWDLETSGFDGKKDKILEIGMFKIENGEIVETKRWVLNHGIEIPQHITEINGMTKAIVDSEGQDPAFCLEEFIQHIRDCDANLTHNGIKFDIVFLVDQISEVLKWEQERLDNLRKKLEYTSIDTAMLYKAHITNNKRLWNESFHQFAKRVGEQIVRGKYNLGICCDELNIDRSKITQHRALGDVELTNLVFKAMLEKE